MRKLKIQNRGNRGFTLIELVVVIAIIAILAAIMVPNLIAYITKAEEAKIMSDLKVFHNGAEVTDKTEKGLKINNDTKHEFENNPELFNKVSEYALVKDDTELSKYGIEKKTDGQIQVKYTHKGKVYTYPKLNLNTGGDTGSITSPMFPDDNTPVATDSDFTWVTKEYGLEVYTATNEIGKGYYNYTGSETEVKIPHEINGHKMTSYYQMFLNSSVTKVVSDNPNITSMDSALTGIKNSKTLDISKLYTGNVKNMDMMFSEYFYGSSITKIIGLDKLDTSNVTTMARMFNDSKVTSLDLSSFNTSNVTKMYGMFDGSRAMSLDLSTFDTSKVVNMSSMFQQSFAETLNLSSFDTSNVKRMNNMFLESKVPTLDISSFNTYSLNEMVGMFAYAEASILDLSSFDTSNVYAMNGYKTYEEDSGSGGESGLFEGAKATKIILSDKFTTAEIYSFDSMFASTTNLDIDFTKFDTSSANSMAGMFDDSKITNLNLSSFDTSNVEDISGMFYGSYATTLDLSSFDTSNVTNITNMFYDSHATTGYARTMQDASRLNNSLNKPSGLIFRTK